MDRDRDAQPGSPWRAESDDDALTASGAWPSSRDAQAAAQGLQAIRRTLRAATPPAGKPAPQLRDQERRTG